MRNPEDVPSEPSTPSNPLTEELRLSSFIGNTPRSETPSIPIPEFLIPPTPSPNLPQEHEAPNSTANTMQPPLPLDGTTTGEVLNILQKTRKALDRKAELARQLRANQKAKQQALKKEIDALKAEIAYLKMGNFASLMNEIATLRCELAALRQENTHLKTIHTLHTNPNATKIILEALQKIDTFEANKQHLKQQLLNLIEQAFPPTPSNESSVSSSQSSSSLTSTTSEVNTPRFFP